jgi:hypothetical protein
MTINNRNFIFAQAVKYNLRKNSLNTDDDFIWTCQYCGIHNVVWVDLTVGSKQDFIEDCRICCRPNRIIVTIDNEEMVFIEARPSDE